MSALKFLWLARMVTGHTNVSAWRQHLGMEDEGHEYQCPCSFTIQTIEHVLRDCPIAERSRRAFLKPDANRNIAPEVLIATREGCDSLYKFIMHSHAFTKDYGVKPIAEFEPPIIVPDPPLADDLPPNPAPSSEG